MIEEIFDLATPWFLAPGQLNAGEEQELKQRRASGRMEVTSQVSSGRAAAVGQGVNMNMSVPIKVIERLGPYLQRVVKAGNGVWEKAVAALAAKGVKVGTVDELLRYMRANWLNTAMVMSTLASVGIAVGDLFSSEDKADPAVRATAVSLDQIALGVDANIGAAAALSETLKPGIADSEVQLATMHQVCSWARAHYGSAAAALAAHQNQQAFFELPYADIETAFRYLR